MEEIEVPQYFLCPISLEIMKDPVTVLTGITYDRESIEKWIYLNKNNSCPVTKQVISDSDYLTPNHTLRRLIQAWCTINSSHGVERIPTPKPPVDKTQIVKLLKTAKSSPNSQLSCLRRIRTIAGESETNKRCVESAGAVEFLVSVVSNFVSSDPFEEASIACDEALSTLYNLHISDDKLNSLVGKNNGEFVDSLMEVMKRGSFESRAYAVMFLKSMLEAANPMKLIGLKSELFVEIIQILKDQISNQASKAALHLLIQTCPWGRNRVKAVEAGGVSVSIELLLASPEKRSSEMLLTALDLMCGCADGRAALLSHGAGMAVVAKKILRVSQVGSERAVRILNSIARFSASPMVLQEMLQLGIVAKLCLLLQVDGGNKTKEKAREILKLHARTWKNSPCIPMNLVSSFPTN